MHQIGFAGYSRGGPQPRRAARQLLRVLIVSGSVGAGHDGAAAVLAALLRRRGLHVDQRDYLTALPRPVRVLMRACYAVCANYAPWLLGWMFTDIERRGFMYFVSMTISALAERRVEEWLAPGYDVVVSTYPWASQTLGQLRTDGRLTCPAATFLTDPAAHRLWVHPRVDQHLTVTQATADQGARDYEVGMHVGGPLVGPGFWCSPESPAQLLARRVIRDELDVPQTAAVALILAGSLGLGDVAATVAAVLAGGAAVPVVVCGRNERLRRQLTAQPGVRALGWRDDIPDLMAAADVLITNAGGLSFTEALVAGLPAVCFAPIPGHGRANARVLDAAGLAPWATTADELTAAVRAAVSAKYRHGVPAAPPCRVDEFVARLASVHAKSYPSFWPGSPSRPAAPTSRGPLADRVSATTPPVITTNPIS